MKPTFRCVILGTMFLLTAQAFSQDISSNNSLQFRGVKVGLGFWQALLSSESDDNQAGLFFNPEFEGIHLNASVSVIRNKDIFSLSYLYGEGDWNDQGFKELSVLWGREVGTDKVSLEYQLGLAYVDIREQIRKDGESSFDFTKTIGLPLKAKIHLIKLRKLTLLGVEGGFIFTPENIFFNGGIFLEYNFQRSKGRQK
ncbi:hypothetical protein ACFQ1M_10910 [Sungkyunkwania multivorans]|uniref:Outer membrane protein beta-barrel domain-containing protein n=1 Tax=Sungkyunkwania multivorans TaxID=1173618 RepID=A0ABW3D0R4_9FLAO